MRMLWLLTIPVTSALVACSVLTDLGSLGGVDASVTDVAVPTEGFTMFVSPKHVVLDPNEPDVTITITIVRAPSFADGVKFTLQGAPSSVKTGVPIDIASGTTTTFGISATLADGVDHEILVTGTSLDGKHAGNAKLGVWLGSRLVPDDAGVITIPPFASQIDVTAWGAGGGGGVVFSDNQVTGTNGGAGGFARASFPVAPGSKLLVSIGTPGLAGGGGGGWSGVRDADGGIWLVAGAGGGGCSYNPGLGGGPGGPGGGVTGANGLGCGGGGGGSQVDGGAPTVCNGASGKAGGPLTGGDALQASKGSSGSPGGGAGPGGSAPGGGGGGGGYRGGASGAYGSGAGGGCGGGGGGSSFVRDGGVDAKLTSGVGSTPSTQDPSYKAPIGVGGAGATSTQTASNGGPGELFVRVPKP